MQSKYKQTTITVPSLPLTAAWQAVGPSWLRHRPASWPSTRYTRPGRSRPPWPAAANASCKPRVRGSNSLWHCGKPPSRKTSSAATAAPCAPTPRGRLIPVVVVVRGAQQKAQPTASRRRRVHCSRQNIGAGSRCSHPGQRSGEVSSSSNIHHHQLTMPATRGLHGANRLYVDNYAGERRRTRLERAPAPRMVAAQYSRPAPPLPHSANGRRPSGIVSAFIVQGKHPRAALVTVLSEKAWLRTVRTRVIV